MQLSRERLAKLLALTGSAVDAEALSAIRTASRLVAQAGLTWVEVLEGRTVGEAAPIPDQTIRLDVGKVLTPPIGRRWSDTVRQLVAGRAWTNSFERNLLFHLGGKLARLDVPHPLTRTEAKFITDTYQQWCQQEPEA